MAGRGKQPAIPAVAAEAQDVPAVEMGAGPGPGFAGPVGKIEIGPLRRAHQEHEFLAGHPACSDHSANFRMAVAQPKASKAPATMSPIKW